MYDPDHRGEFDPHAFPPLLRGVNLLLSALVVGGVLLGAAATIAA